MSAPISMENHAPDDMNPADASISVSVCATAKAATGFTRSRARR